MASEADPRIDYLSDGLSAGDLDEAMMAELDAIRAALASESTWMVTATDLRERIVEAVAADRQAQPRRRGFVGWVAGIAIGAAAASLVAIAVARTSDDDGAATTAPDDVIEITGTELSPTSSGTAEVTAMESGLQVVLAVPGLPRRDGDEFYEAWLKNADGTRLVPIGTFHEADHVILWAGVSLDDYPILTVTRETAAGPKDDAQGSSGEVVVKGQKLGP